MKSAASNLLSSTTSNFSIQIQPLRLFKTVIWEHLATTSGEKYAKQVRQDTRKRQDRKDCQDRGDRQDIGGRGDRGDRQDTQDTQNRQDRRDRGQLLQFLRCFFKHKSQAIWQDWT